MRLVIQRCRRASVAVSGEVTGAIAHGLLILVGVVESDTLDDVRWCCRKVAGMRIFNDEAGVMNRSVVDVAGGLLVVSQFTLHASTRKGNRPSYIRAAKPEVAEPMYERFVAELAQVSGIPVQTGIFGADMQVELVNDGPVTIIIDTEHKE